jgi:hypothetical protein
MIPIGTGLGGLISQVVEDIGGRTLALRLPWIVAGLGNLALMVWAWSRLNSRTVEAARAAADDTPGPAG